jgi:hypothetical protein
MALMTDLQTQADNAITNSKEDPTYVQHCDPQPQPTRGDLVAGGVITYSNQRPTHLEQNGSSTTQRKHCMCLPWVCDSTVVVQGFS